MDDQILFSLPANEKLTELLAKKLKVEIGKSEIRNFPDGETYIRIDSSVTNKIALLICTLNAPNPKVLPLLFMAQALRKLGVKKICLVCPYLPYMRQDKQFHPGEALSSVFFAQLLANYIDDMVTIDPHLHRIHHLSEIYKLPGIVTLHATGKIAEWLAKHVKDPVLIGPDEESKQWVSEIANSHDIPFVIGKKQRLGDKQVIVSLPEINNKNQTPVLVDDVIASGSSMLEVLKQLNGFKKILCIAVHALFDEETENQLLLAGAERIISCNTVIHKTNQIDISDLLAQGITNLC